MKKEHFIWILLKKTDVSRYAELVWFLMIPDKVSINHFILKLMGYPDIKVLVN